ncbi:MAG: hypothetical protein AAGH68_05735, partial [Pseudomonadota bacterium]
LGDLNGDSALTDADIAAFVLALTDPDAYAQAYPGLDPDIDAQLQDYMARTKAGLPDRDYF